MTLTELLARLVSLKTPKGIRRVMPSYYRVGGALLARGKWVNPKDRTICQGLNCKCAKHFKHAKKGTVTA